MKTRRELQTFLGVESDNIWGKQSQSALASVIANTGEGEQTSALIPIDGTTHIIDARSAQNIATLLEPVQVLAKRLIKECARQGIFIQVTSGTRTYAEQDALFAQGGVTKARGGYSNHNFGLAFDVTIDQFPDPKLQPVWESPLYKKIGAIGKSLGLSWGGDWTSIVDEPHFELRPGWAKGMSESTMITALRARKALNESLL